MSIIFLAVGASISLAAGILGWNAFFWLLLLQLWGANMLIFCLKSKGGQARLDHATTRQVAVRMPDKFERHKAHIDAQAKAEALAKEVLGKDLELWAQGKLFIESKEMGGKYTISGDGKVAFYPSGDYASRGGFAYAPTRPKRGYQFCIVPEYEDVPLLDKVVAMYLMCKNDERKLWNTANIS